jgi:putative glycosyltransferase (TIGR04372 family)
MLQFIRKQIAEVRTGGISVIVRKTGIIVNWIWNLIIHIPFYLLSIPLVLIVRLLKPWLLIRIGGLVSSRIGHFAANVEMYLCEKDAGINRPQQNYLDLFYFAYKPICNYQLARMWKRVLNIFPEVILGSLRKVNKLLPGWEIHEIGQNTQSDRDVHNLLDLYPAHLKFTDEEQQKGEIELRKLGVPEKAPIVCLFVRDSAYLNKQFGGGYEYHNYRDCNIQNYLLAAEELASRGYYVIRMGVTVNQPLNSDDPKIIDYAGKGLRTDFMDIYLGSKCEFCISSSAGWDTVPAWLFRRPTIFTNVLPVGYLLSFSRKFLLTTRRYIESGSNRELTLKEIFNRGFGFFLSVSDYMNAGITLVENNPQEIRDVAVEMVERLTNSFDQREDDNILQRRFWGIFPVYATDTVNANPLHGEIRAKFSTHYLRNNSDWLS